MDPKKPEKDKAESRPSAEDRVDALIAGRPADPKPEPGQASQRLQEKRKAEATGKPVLTEKQRIEARRKRQATRKRRPAVSGNAISRGVRATGFEVKRTFLFLGRGILSGIDSLKPLGEKAAAGLRRLIAWVAAGLVLLAGIAGRLLAGLGQLLLKLDGIITARRAFTFVAVVAAGLLVVSQFMDFRAIEIGQPGYVQVQDITSAPRSDVKSPIDAHSLILVVAGVAALLAAAATAVSRRRILAGVLVFAGGLTLAVALAIDLPIGLDADNAELSYAGVKAILLSGFWLEVCAGAVLLVAGVALALEPNEKRMKVRERRSARADIAAGSRA
ncbi:MAG TPA: hypothetical protein VMF31_02840 [Solirubrobacterales bacterium]|nr:hypothetical protein [Solirubrobacterales bacterium]